MKLYAVTFVEPKLPSLTRCKFVSNEHSKAMEWAREFAAELSEHEGGTVETRAARLEITDRDGEVRAYVHVGIVDGFDISISY